MTTTMIALGSLIVGILITWIVCRLLPKEEIHKANQALKDKEHELELSIKDQERQLEDLKNQFSQQRNEQQRILENDMRNWENEKSDKNLSFLKSEMELKEEIAKLEGQIQERKDSITKLDNQTSEAVKTLEQRTYDLMVEDLTKLADTEINYCKHLSNQAKQEYEQMMRECMEQYRELTAKNVEDYQILMQQLEEAKAKANAIIEANKRAELEKEAKDFYRLQLSDIDIEEINKIRSIEPYLRKKEPLNKVIWKVYYEKPFTDLIGRVVGTKICIGIYKITNLTNGMVYIGQSNNIAERWRQHIKRGVGADPPTQNKLYPAMLEYGAENFTFEIIEECSASQLTEREKYYTDIFQANSYGYVVRKG